MFKCKTASPHGGISWRPTLQSGHWWGLFHWYSFGSRQWISVRTWLLYKVTGSCDYSNSSHSVARHKASLGTFLLYKETDAMENFFLWVNLPSKLQTFNGSERRNDTGYCWWELKMKYHNESHTKTWWLSQSPALEEFSYDVSIFRSWWLTVGFPHPFWQKI